MCKTTDTFFIRLLLTIAITVLVSACSNYKDGVLTNSAVPAKLGTNVSDALVTGPITEDAPIVLESTSLDLSAYGYTAEEYFLEGVAASYVNEDSLGADGFWQVSESGQREFYKTRLVVYRPLDRTNFNGTVILEWLNVTAFTDATGHWLMAHPELMRRGAVWVGISAQKVGVEFVPSGLKGRNPQRYQSLWHPGDSFSYDILSQAAKALRNPQGPAPLGDLHAQRLIVSGGSQSAKRLLTYINALGPDIDLIDGYLIHGVVHLPEATAPLSEAPQTLIEIPQNLLVRQDIQVPVMMLMTETDVAFLGGYKARQADSNWFRLWEIAGTGHGDRYTMIDAKNDTGSNPAVTRIEEVYEIDSVIKLRCAKPLNSGPHFIVLRAAIRALDLWIQTGEPPAMADRLAITKENPELEVDEFGNALGGIRTPMVDVPVARLSGGGQGMLSFCTLFGTTELFNKSLLDQLYIDNDSYVDQVRQSTNDAVEKGFILAEEAALIIAEARTGNALKN